MPLIPIPFGPWAPDRGDQDEGGLQVARNVVPAEGRYRPLRQFSAAHTSGPAGGGVLTAKALAAPGAAPVIFAATASAIYRSTDRSFSSINTGFTSSSWEFAQWGSEVLASSPDEGLYYGAIASGSLSQQSGAPLARHVARFGDFIMLGAVGGVENRIQWSGFDDRTAWTPDALTQAGFQDLPVEHGAVTGIAWGEYPTVFQERAISRVTYVGPPLIFQIDTFPVEKGCIASGSIVRVAGLVFFISQDGPNVWNGQTAQPIAEGSFRRWWRDSVAPAQAATARVSVDWSQGAIIWQWGGGGLIYSWNERRAAEFAPGEDFAALLSAPDSEQLGDAASHPAWSDGLATAAAINSSGHFGMFSGAPYEATFETSEVAASPDSRALVTEVWPDVSAANCYVTLGSRELRPSDALVYGDEMQVNSHGFSEHMSDARWHRVRLRIPAGAAWTHSRGVNVQGQPTGKL